MSLKRQVMVVYFAGRDSQMPLWLKLTAIAVAAYAFSPIDLIPDFIPVLGLLDDLILLPAGIALILRFTPTAVIQRARIAATQATPRPSSKWMAIVIIVAWVVVAMLALAFLREYWTN